ncbi:hypothetical protein L210DRAFT_3648555 [Boletus edulis BED1]|uniref:Uncharacterized protein n=1 Tax=Boletus edulis BED1 TaxID=1328754 RepID=A0AAD4BNV0_BOLED|nr:hypothetical protein L210DRAFT_3648555 [Boletus edulis BED1]
MQGRWSTPLNIHFGNLLHTKGVVPLNIIFVFPPPALTPSANPGAAVPDPNSIHFGPTAKGKKGKPSTSADPHEQLNEPGTRGRYLEAADISRRPISRGGRWSNNMDLGDIRLPSQPPEDDEPSGSSGQPKEEDVLMDGPSVTLQEDADVIMFAGLPLHIEPDHRLAADEMATEAWMEKMLDRDARRARLAQLDTWIRCRETLTAVQAEKFTEEVGRSGFSLENIDPEVIKEAILWLDGKAKTNPQFGRQVFFGDASSSNAAIGPCLNTCFDIFLKMAARRVELIRGQKAMLQALDRICCPLEISDIYDYVVAGRTSLPPPASPPRSPIAGPSTGITFPDIFHLVPEEAVRSESYDPNDLNPSDYEEQIARQIKREEEEADLQEQDQLADYDSSLDQGYRTLVNRTTLAPEDAPSTIVRATTIDTADLPGQLARTNAVWTEDRLSPTNADRDLVYPPIGSPIYNPSTPTRAPSELPEPIDWEPIYHRLTRLRAQHSVHHRDSTPAAPRESELEASIVRAIREGIELGRQQTRDLARIERARREVQQAADRIQERIRIRERTPTPIPHIPDLPRWFRIPDSRLYVSVLISRTVSEYAEINETPENIQVRPENPEPAQRPRIRQAQLAALAEQEAAAEAGEPLPPPQRTLRIPAPLAPRNPDFEPEQADHSALENESSENLNYPA